MFTLKMQVCVGLLALMRYKWSDRAYHSIPTPGTARITSHLCYTLKWERV